MVPGIAIEVALVVAIPAPGGIRVGEPAGAVAGETVAIAGFPPERGGAGFDTGAVAGDGHSLRDESQDNGRLDTRFSEDFLQQALRLTVEAAAFQNPVNKFLNDTLAFVWHFVLAVFFL